MDTLQDIEAALAALLQAAPQILADSQGTGSIAKYAKLASDAVSLAGTIATAVTAHPAVAATA